MRAPALAALVVTAAAAACTDVDPAPTATVLAAAPDTLWPADDTRNDLAIQIEYADGDGDLGRGLARVHDCRADGLVTELMVPAIVADDAVDQGVAITGELDLRVNDVGDVAVDGAAPAACAALGVAAPAAGQAVFCVELVDSAGHSGPGDCTDPITIRLQ